MSHSNFSTSVFVTTIAKQNSNRKRYECKQCPKHFSRPSALQTHVYTHTGEKPHQCTITGCGRRFAVISNLRRHLRVHRPNYVRRRLTSQERREYVERLIQKSGTSVEERIQTLSCMTNSPNSTPTSSGWLNPVFENSYRLLKPKDPRPSCLIVKYLLN